MLDLSAYIAGPYGCALLADLGAEVIKIEPPGGDNLRKYPSTLEAESRAFVGVNRSKLGIVLDLKAADDHAALIDLVRTADVLVHNFRPAVPARLGIAYEQLQAINPRLIYCAVSGYGERGPLKDKAGYDQVLQSMTGMCSLQGKADGPPEILYGLGGGLLRRCAGVGRGVRRLVRARAQRKRPVCGGVFTPLGLGDAISAPGMGCRRAEKCRTRHALWWHHRPSPEPDKGTSTSRPIPRTSGTLCARRSACTAWPRTSATTACASATSTRPRSCRSCMPHSRPIRRLNGKPCLETKYPALRPAMSMTCSTTRR